MRLFLVLSIFFYSIAANAQNCKPNINVIVNVCDSRLIKDSLSTVCNNYPSGLRASDTSYSIISYIVRADGAGFDDGMGETFNTGAAFNEAKRIVSKLRIGSYVEFSCIKAKDKNGQIYILQPLALKL